MFCYLKTWSATAVMLPWSYLCSVFFILYFQNIYYETIPLFFFIDKNATLEGLVKLLGNWVKHWNGLILKYLMKDLGHRLSFGKDHVGEFQEDRMKAKWAHCSTTTLCMVQGDCTFPFDCQIKTRMLSKECTHSCLSIMALVTTWLLYTWAMMPNAWLLLNQGL